MALYPKLKKNVILEFLLKIEFHAFCTLRTLEKSGFRDLPDSKTFDVILMITLLRNLTSVSPPACGFDDLPSETETMPGADLARIKYYRNYMAHLGHGKIDTPFFNTAWNDITSAIDRLGGQQMKQECDYLKIRPLDQTNQEIMLEIKRSNDEIRDLKESFERLEISNTEIKKSHKLLQEDHADVSRELQNIKTAQKDTVSWNVRDAGQVYNHNLHFRGQYRSTNELMKFLGTESQPAVIIYIYEQINKILVDWENNVKMFINTRAAQHVLKCIQENSCVTITASSGAGKTATLQYVALQMSNEEYDVIIVSDPDDIIKFHNPNKKALFVIDDLCGNFSVDQSDIKKWNTLIELMCM
ncbi:hypothetical protein AM593_00488, partial [Mytilus galloprovincialis]